MLLMAAKRVDLSLADKVHVVEALHEPSAKQVQVAKKFGVSKSLVSCLLKKNDDIFKEYATSTNCDGKEADDKVLWLWFQHKLGQGAHLSRLLLKQKATQLAAEKGKEFNLSDSWLSHWNARHNVAQHKEYVEKQDADLPAAAEWRTDTLPSILVEYQPRDVSNTDETSLFYRGFPDRGLNVLMEHFTGSKKAMDCITLLCCANMDGTEKQPLLVIRKSKSPHGFSKDHASLPVIYRNSAKAWMTSLLFQEWLKNWDRELCVQHRCVCLLIDNCSAHLNDVDLFHIVLTFLPPNATSIMQPMDMGVIKNLKGHYHARLKEQIVAALDIDSSH
ncbi:tigger transposable element-derived protein 6-like [Latimeria chalumnae]|uniref:tigger transposable element-derived protein 6-like n=1 Tax=Latimeria chalumnae TaxID=7897 RepID=UPI0003C12188|nr:PREDICTED: tigger transposable element-derived protein 6-like [Latimeria chalumnae]|eukprot:XP_005995615.1 PREDICTED: tigger transposable element-derived protein 6-like [Latimeria chalumnae]